MRLFQDQIENNEVDSFAVRPQTFEDLGYRESTKMYVDTNTLQSIPPHLLPEAVSAVPGQYQAWAESRTQAASPAAVRGPWDVIDLEAPRTEVDHAAADAVEWATHGLEGLRASSPRGGPTGPTPVDVERNQQEHKDKYFQRWRKNNKH